MLLLYQLTHTLINSIYSKLHIDNVTQEKIKYKCYIYNDVLKVPNEIEFNVGQLCNWENW